jgi:hypothetical protein
VLLRNEDVGHGRLARQVAERGLDRAAIVDLVQLDGVELCARLGEQLLGGFAVGAVGLGEDGDGVLWRGGVLVGCGRERGCGCALWWWHSELVGFVGRRTSSMIDWTFVFVADIVRGERERVDVKKLRKKEMVAVFA